MRSETIKHQPGRTECQETRQPQRAEGLATSSPSGARRHAILSKKLHALGPQPCSQVESASGVPDEFFRAVSVGFIEIYNSDDKCYPLYVYNSASFDNCTQLPRPWYRVTAGGPLAPVRITPELQDGPAFCCCSFAPCRLDRSSIAYCLSLWVTLL